MMQPLFCWIICFATGLAGKEGPLGIDRHHPVPFLFAEIQKGDGADHASVVDPGIDPSESIDNLVHGSTDLLYFGDIVD